MLTVSAALVCGGTMHRAPPTRFLGFITLWSVLIYYPVARWSWDSDGWSNKLGVMDFAGGTPVHIVSGTTVAAFAVFCGIEERRESGEVVAATERLFKSLYKRMYKRLINPWVELWKTLLSLVRYCAVRYFGKSPPVFEDDESDGDSYDEYEQEVEPYSVNYVVLGTAILVSHRPY
ncbi:MAG: hypothetical protein CL912_30690 [Deltaproteobacteria bacterium]|nr:hypothetical protein [Deltaproteobacteria bacterium]